MTRHGTEPASLERRREIVRAGLDVLEEGGFDRLSLRRLATHLGMHAPGLYWYIESKQELVDLMAKTILDEGLASIAPPAEGQSWQEWLVELACSTRRALLAYRDGARVVAGAYVVRNGSITPIIEQALEILESAGFDRFTALGATMTVFRYATGIALDEQASPLQSSPNESMAERFAKLPRPEIDVSRFPRTADALTRAFDQNVGHFPVEDAKERLFRFGAEMFVRGLAGTPGAT
ncbi:MAG: TetR/AcrR family transcriptional regulator C-terminal domain-containing protein [Gemmatimonadaceae bacterium]